MTKLTKTLIDCRFPTPLKASRTRETELSALICDEWRERFLAPAQQTDKDVWVFSYGSLMWDGEVSTPEIRVALVHGWHRRFCLLQWAWRGDLDNPCLMLALDRGGRCQGIVYRVPGPGAVEALRDVWDREMNGDGYRPRWVNARTDAGPVRALTFVINRGGERYAGRLSDADTARHIASACGSTGSCAEYLRRTVRSLEKLKLRDQHLERLETLVATEMGVTT
jgi:cation transport protein ChaC